MPYAILNSSGNVLEWFDDEAAALTALEEITYEAPGSVDLVAFDDAGKLVEDYVPEHQSLVWTRMVQAGTLTFGSKVGTTLRSTGTPVLPVVYRNGTGGRVPAQQTADEVLPA